MAQLELLSQMAGNSRVCGTGLPVLFPQARCDKLAASSCHCFRSHSQRSPGLDCGPHDRFRVWRLQTNRYKQKHFQCIAFEAIQTLNDNQFVFSKQAKAKLVAIVGDGVVSPLGGATWSDVMQHMVKRLQWVDSGFEMVVVNNRDLKAELPRKAIESLMHSAEILIAVSVQDDNSVKWIQGHSENVPTIVCFDSSTKLPIRLGGRNLLPAAPLDRFRVALPGNDIGQRLKVLRTVEQTWGCYNSDNVRFVLLYLINDFVSPVKSLKKLRANDLDTLIRMISSCGPQILACLLDSNCRKALSCLTKCASTDQVCSYRCIASCESPQLEAFSLCVLQKNNCLGLSAEIPDQPDVKPLEMFRGLALTHDVAEDIFIGWLGKFQWSWRVVAGQNAAYDQFPCQFQLFYRGKARGSMWYDPVFGVKTLDERSVWRRRHYSVKRGNNPGTFLFSVLDNGVVSREYWRIVDVTDDLAWGLFFYSGAASVVGQSYTGAVLVSPDGIWPADIESERLKLAFEKCGIKHWEMYQVNNLSCKNPPLDVPADAQLHSTGFWTDGNRHSLGETVIL